MRVLQFTIPVAHEKNIIVQRDVLPHFYPHLHRHNEIQLTWVQQGEGTLVADNNMHTFRGNEIFWISDNQPHVFKSDPSYFLPRSKKKIHAMMLFFNPVGPLAPLFELQDTKGIKSFMHQHKGGFKLPQSQVADISQKMLRIRDTSGALKMICFLELLQSLYNIKDLASLGAGVQSNIPNEHEGVRIGSIYNYIMQHYEDPLTLEDVAKRAHMTPQAFCRYFKKHTRHTFISFLNEVRINEACKQLTAGSYESIANIAYSCGFNSVTNFNRVFKTVTGKAPGEYVDHYFHHVETSFAPEP